MNFKRVTLVLFALLLSGCFAQNRVSKFASSSIELGMTRKAFVAKFGAPFLQEKRYIRENQPVEVLLYKEALYRGGWYNVTTEFVFVKDTLIQQTVRSMEQMYKEGCDEK